MYDLLAALLILFPQLAPYAERLPGLSVDHQAVATFSGMSLELEQAFIRVCESAELDGPSYIYYGFTNLAEIVESKSHEFWNLLDAPRRSSFAALLPPSDLISQNLHQAEEAVRLLQHRANFTDLGRKPHYEDLVVDAQQRARVWGIIRQLSYDPGTHLSNYREKARELMEVIGPRAFFSGSYPSPVSSPAATLVFPLPEQEPVNHPADLPR